MHFLTCFTLHFSHHFTSLLPPDFLLPEPNFENPFFLLVLEYHSDILFPPSTFSRFLSLIWVSTFLATQMTTFRMVSSFTVGLISNGGPLAKLSTLDCSVGTKWGISWIYSVKFAVLFLQNYFAFIPILERLVDR